MQLHRFRFAAYAQLTILIVAVLSFYCAATLILFWPFFSHLSGALIGPPEDNLQDFWNVWYAVQTGWHNFFSTSLLRFPEGTPLNYHSFSYPHVFVVSALSRIFGTQRETLVVLNNIVLLASFPLAGTGAFFLVHYFVPNKWAALLGGFIFAFNPSHVAHLMHHAHVTHIEFIPFFVLCYLHALDQKKWIWVGAASVLGALCALSCWYYLFYAIYFIGFHSAYLRWHDKQPLTGWRLQVPAACIGGIFLLLSPLLIPMLLQTGSVEQAGGTDKYVADIEAFFVFPATHIFAGWSTSFFARAASWTGNSVWEGVVYLGLVNIVLLGWLYRRNRQNTVPVVNYLFWAMLVFAVIAAGDCIHAFGFDTLIPLPGIVPSHLPFFGQARTPSRAIVMVYLFLAVAIAYAVTWLAREWHGRWSKLSLAAIVLLITLDFYPTHLEMAPASCPAGLDIIANDPGTNFGVLYLPFHDTGDLAMFQQTCHGKPLVHALISRSARPALIDRIDWNDFAKQRAQLKQANVKYIVIAEHVPWKEIRDMSRYRVRMLLIQHFPSLNNVKWIRIPADQPVIPQAFYRNTYRTVFRSPDFTILRVQ